MPNTKSAERRARVGARRHTRNKAIKTGLRTLERKYRTLVAAGKTEDAGKALRDAASALDKAAKRGVIPKRRASRKKSRLAVSLGKVAKKA